MEIQTIGFTQKPAARFFGLLKENQIARLIDVRISNSSQLAGYSKQDDLAYFLQEICGAEYIHEPLLTPTKDLFKAYRSRAITWERYGEHYLDLLRERRVEHELDPALFEVPTVLLCSEPTAERCHRRLVVEYLADAWGDIEVKHL